MMQSVRHNDADLFPRQQVHANRPKRDKAPPDPDPPDNEPNPSGKRCGWRVQERSPGSSVSPSRRLAGGYKGS